MTTVFPWRRLECYRLEGIGIEALEQVKLEVSVVELIAAFRFRAVKSLDLSAMRRLSWQLRLDDPFLSLLIANNVWKADLYYRHNSLTDAAITDFAFRDCSDGGDERKLIVWKDKVTPELLEQLAKVSMANQGGTRIVLFSFVAIPVYI